MGVNTDALYIMSEILRTPFEIFNRLEKNVILFIGKV